VRLARLGAAALAFALLSLWFPMPGVGALVGLLTILMLDGWLFTRRVRRALTTEPTKGSHEER
jgi:xanthosine utilization system XapX-like protein